MTNGRLRRKGPGRAKLINGVLLAAGTITVTVVTDPPGDALGWVFLVVGSVVLAVVGAGLVEWLGNVLMTLPHEKIVAFLVVMVLVGTVGVVGANWMPSIRIGPCDPPAQVRVLTAPELLGPYRALADEFERTAAEQDGSCRPAEVHVFAMPAARAITGLNAGWSAEYLREGPRPDVWLPESGMHVEAVRATREKTKFGPAMQVVESLGSSPIVLALPARTGVELTDEQWQGKPWRTLVDQLRENRISLVRPSSSTVGELATVAIYASADGIVRLRQNASWARGVESWLDSSATAGRYPSGADVDALLIKQRELGTSGSALVLSELDLIRYNESVRGPNGRGCDAPHGPPACMRAIYPSDTHSLDRPLALLTWAEAPQSAEQRDAAVAFRSWLTSSAGSNAAVLQRLRPLPGIPLQYPLSMANGVVPGGPPNFVKQQASPRLGVADELTGIQAAVRRTGRVLISLDASGSMRQRVGGETRYSLAVKAVHAGLDSVDERTEVSLNVFSATMGVRPVDRVSIGQVQPAGNTPQHQALLEGMRAAGPGGVLVLLTDGTNNVDNVSAAQLAEQTGTRVLVLAFGEASCGAQVLTEVTGRTGGSCRQTAVDTLAEDLEQLLRSARGGGTR